MKYLSLLCVGLFFWLLLCGRCLAETYTLSWDETTDSITGYRLYYKEASAQDFSLFWEGTQNLYQFDDSVLIPGTDYVFVVRAYNSYMESSDSNTAKFPDDVSSANCPNCSGSDIVIENVTFQATTVCVCSATQSITVGPGVVIENGSTVTFRAPVITMLSGVEVQEGADFKTQRE